MDNLDQYSSNQQQQRSAEYVGYMRDHYIDPASVAPSQRIRHPTNEEDGQSSPQPNGDLCSRTVNDVHVDVVALQIGTEPVHCRRIQ